MQNSGMCKPTGNSKQFCNLVKLFALRMYALQNYLWIFLFPPNVLYFSQVELLTISPLLYQPPAHINYHLFPAPFQFGTLFPTLLSLLLFLLPLGHMLHPLLVIYMCPYSFVCIFSHSTHSVCN